MNKSSVLTNSFIRPPEPLALEGLDVSSLKLWLDAFVDYVELGHPGIDDKKKRQLFLTIAGLPTRRLVSGLTLCDDSYATLITALEKHVQPVKSITLARHKFFSRVQGPEEDISMYVADLKRLCNDCDFSDTSIDSIENQLIRDQLIKGVTSKKISQTLLKESKLPLHKAVETAQSIEQAEKDIKAIHPPTNTADVNYVRRRGSSAHSGKSDNSGRKRPNKNVECYTCHKKGHLARDCFKNKTCRKCGKKGHTDKVCRSKGQTSDAQTYTIESSFSGIPFSSATFEEYPAKFMIDTGSSITIISRDFLVRNNLLSKCQPCSYPARVADGNEMCITQRIYGNLCLEGVSLESHYFVHNIHVDGILGMDKMMKFGIKLTGSPALLCSIVPPIVKSYAHVFDRPMRDTYLKNILPISIVQTPEERPYQAPVRRLKASDEAFLRSEIPKMLEAGIIRESQSPWRHHPVIVPKRSGGLRLAINYRPVNSQTVFDAFPLPTMESLLAKVGKAKFFSKLNFTHFYWQLPLCDEDKPKTAFYALDKLYEFNRVPFGLKNAVACCTRVLSEVFKDIPNVIIYLDDVLVIGGTKAEHDEALLAVFRAIEKFNLSLNLKKCMFNQTSICYLGHVVGNGEIKPDPERIQTLVNFPEPDDFKSLERFLGMANYWSQFIENFSEIALPLYELKRCGRFDKFNTVQRKAFKLIKERIQEALLAVPSPQDKLLLRTDASKNCVSALLHTEDRRPVCFFSRILSATEQRYDVLEKEALAIFWGVRKCRDFLLDREFVVLSDHKPLEYLFRTEKVSAKILRWRMQLQEFTFEVKHCAATDNVAADCFSRICSIELNSVVTVEDIKLAQQTDNQCKILSRAITSGYTKKPRALHEDLWSNLSRFTIKDGAIKWAERFLIPYKLRLKVLTAAHSCHCGVDATERKISAFGYWPNYGNDVKKFVNSCRTCSLVKPNFVPATLSPICVKAPMELLAVDYVGPLPTSRGFSYLLVFIDHYSRYPFVFPVRDLTVKTLIECTREVFSFAGFPSAILSDKGTQFESNEFKTFLQQFNIKKLATTAYHPAGNGLCERFNKTLQQKIFALLTENNEGREQWVKKLSLALFHLRSTPHAATKVRPMDLFFSFKPKTFLPNEKLTNSKIVDQNIKKQQQRNQRNFDKKAFDRKFKKDEEVLVKAVKHEKFGGKGSIARVLHQLNKHVVKVKFIDSGVIKVINVARISRVSRECHKTVDFAGESYREFDSVDPPITVSAELPTHQSHQLVTHHDERADQVAVDNAPAPHEAVNLRRSSRISATPHRYNEMEYWHH